MQDGFEPEACTVILVNLSPMYVELLGAAIDQHHIANVVGRAQSQAATEALLQAYKPRIALVGSQIVDGKHTGLPFVEQINMLAPVTRQIVLEQESSENGDVLFLRAGARGLLCETDLTLPVLLKCIECVAAGQTWANSMQLEKLLTSISGPRSLRVNNAFGAAILSRREEEVLHLLAEGLTNRELANVLHLSEHTVKNHIFRIFNKLGVSSRIEAVLYALN